MVLAITSGAAVPGGVITRLIAALLSTLPVASVTVGTTKVDPMNEGVPDSTPSVLSVSPVGSGKNGDSWYV
jgi:hypothetical protein